MEFLYQIHALASYFCHMHLNNYSTSLSIWIIVKFIYFQVKRLKILYFTHRVHLRTPYGSQNKQLSHACTERFL